MRKYLEDNNFQNIDFIYNNSYIYENRIIVGTRGWETPDSKENKKIVRRENIRLELSIQDGIRKYGDDKDIIVCMHYPPFNGEEELEMNYIDTMKKYDVKKCIYGHIHGEVFHGVIEGSVKGIDFNLVSCDYLKFKLLRIC